MFNANHFRQLNLFYACKTVLAPLCGFFLHGTLSGRHYYYYKVHLVVKLLFRPRTAQFVGIYVMKSVVKVKIIHIIHVQCERF